MRFILTILALFSVSYAVTISHDSAYYDTKGVKSTHGFYGDLHGTADTSIKSNHAVKSDSAGKSDTSRASGISDSSKKLDNRYLPLHGKADSAVVSDTSKKYDNRYLGLHAKADSAHVADSSKTVYHGVVMDSSKGTYHAILSDSSTKTGQRIFDSLKILGSFYNDTTWRIRKGNDRDGISDSWLIEHLDYGNSWEFKGSMGW